MALGLSVLIILVLIDLVLLQDYRLLYALPNWFAIEWLFGLGMGLSFCAVTLAWDASRKRLPYSTLLMFCATFVLIAFSLLGIFAAHLTWPPPEQDKASLLEMGTFTV